MEPYISVFDILKIGIGPSSSHTYGPWMAASEWISELADSSEISQIQSIKVLLYGSLALTGKGHYTDIAIVLGLCGKKPETVSPAEIAETKELVFRDKKIILPSGKGVAFDPNEIVFRKEEFLPFHPNGMRLIAMGETGQVLNEAVYFSIGGGFIVKEGRKEKQSLTSHAIPFNYAGSSELATLCLEKKLTIAEVVRSNEKSFRTSEEIDQKMLAIWEVMKQSAYEGCHTTGFLPGRLKVKRRAAELNKELLRVDNYTNADGWIEAMKVGRDFRKVLTRVSCLAIAVNEVNASMGRVVTAPTNGSAGVIPAVLLYYICFSGQQVSEKAIIDFLLTAAEIGKFFKKGATISAAAGGCQAEIGVSSSMAAGALTEALGGTVAQVLMAAEIAAEHHLGLTCDPVDGLVQIPCIERNSMGAVKAITAAMIALAGDPESARVSLDTVIRAMKETAESMSTKFKETSLGGLAVQVGVNLPEC